MTSPAVSARSACARGMRRWDKSAFLAPPTWPSIYEICLAFDAYLLARCCVAGEPLDDLRGNDLRRFDALGFLAGECQRSHARARGAGVDNVHLEAAAVGGRVRIGAE